MSTLPTCARLLVVTGAVLLIAAPAGATAPTAGPPPRPLAAAASPPGATPMAASAAATLAAADQDDLCLREWAAYLGALAEFALEVAAPMLVPVPVWPMAMPAELYESWDEVRRAYEALARCRAGG